MTVQTDRSVLELAEQHPARAAGSRASATASPSPTRGPSPGRYPWQWYWDSCFAAIVWRRFDPSARRARAREPARRRSATTASSATRSSGTGRVAWPRRSSTTSPPAAPSQTETIQPPLLAWAWRIAVGDPADGAADRAPPRLAGAPTATSRATACSGSSSPTSRASTPRPSSTRSGAGAPHGRLGFPLLVAPQPAASAGTRGGSATRGGPVLCEVVDQRALVPRCGSPRASPRSPRRWSTGSGTSGRGLFLDEVAARRARGPRSRPGRRWRRWRCPTCPRRSAGAWSRSTCSTRARSGRRSPPPSVAAERAELRAADGGRGLIRRYWRGPTWVNSAWLLWLGLRRLGYEAEAERTWPTALIGAVVREGLREYYDPLHGRGPGRASTSPGRR